MPSSPPRASQAGAVRVFVVEVCGPCPFYLYCWHCRCCWWQQVTWRPTRDRLAVRNCIIKFNTTITHDQIVISFSLDKLLAEVDDSELCKFTVISFSRFLACSYSICYVQAIAGKYPVSHPGSGLKSMQAGMPITKPNSKEQMHMILCLIASCMCFIISKKQHVYYGLCAG